MKVKSESEVAQLCPTHRLHGLQPTRLLRPWDFLGKSTGVGCHCLLRENCIGGLKWSSGCGVLREKGQPTSDLFRRKDGWI